MFLLFNGCFWFIFPEACLTIKQLQQNPVQENEDSLPNESELREMKEEVAVLHRVVAGKPRFVS